MDKTDNKKTACAVRRYEVTKKDLPLSCPMDSMKLWNAHPKVYLPIDETEEGKISCYYCGTTYVLVEDTET